MEILWRTKPRPMYVRKARGCLFGEKTPHMYCILFVVVNDACVLNFIIDVFKSNKRQFPCVIL